MDFTFGNQSFQFAETAKRFCQSEPIIFRRLQLFRVDIHLANIMPTPILVKDFL